MKIYRGWRLFAATLSESGDLESERHTASGVRVVVSEGGEERDLPLRLDLRNHSPDGFNWGYGGSGPAQLALAICADCLGWKRVEQAFPALYQGFKGAYVARWGDAWEITDEEVRIWVAAELGVAPKGGAS